MSVHGRVVSEPGRTGGLRGAGSWGLSWAPRFLRGGEHRPLDPQWLGGRAWWVLSLGQQARTPPPRLPFSRGRRLQSPSASPGLGVPGTAVAAEAERGS